MTRDTFKLIHSELIQQVQCIENNLKIIYASMKSGKFRTNLQDVKTANLGTIARWLEDLDYSDGCPELSGDDYDTINEIRLIRNYWCHQCYLDFVYIENNMEREIKFQEIANRLHYDETRTYALLKKTEEMCQFIYNKYR